MSLCDQLVVLEGFARDDKREERPDNPVESVVVVGRHVGNAAALECSLPNVHWDSARGELSDKTNVRTALSTCRPPHAPAESEQGGSRQASPPGNGS